MTVLLAVGAALLIAVCAYVTGLPWQIALFVTAPLASVCAYAACHLDQHRDRR